MEIVENISARRMPRVRVRRQAGEENILERLEHEVEEDAEIISDKTGMPTWSGGLREASLTSYGCGYFPLSVFVMFALILLVIVGVIGWCAWRLLAKKRTKTGQKQQDIDEQAILDAMEEEMDVNEEELKVCCSLNMSHHCSASRVPSRSIWASCSTS